jgi:hypothetical protein
MRKLLRRVLDRPDAPVRDALIPGRAAKARPREPEAPR